MTNAPLSPDLLYKTDVYWRAAKYLSVGQIYLYDNPLLKEPLKLSHLKPRVVGHWGTTPGQNFIYVHLNRVIKEQDLDMFYVSGPGHGAPAIVGNVYLEGTWSEIYPDVTQEGEAETGPLATAWRSTKMLDPVTDGAVLPILPLNGFKISNLTLLARIEHEKLEQFFRGCGWTPLFVEGDDPLKMHQLMAAALREAVSMIHQAQRNAREHKGATRQRWPMIMLRSPKGWTGPKVVDGLPNDGTLRSHQVPLLVNADHPEHVAPLERWMQSYKAEELFDPNGRLVSELAELAPKGKRRMGSNPHANGGLLLNDLHMPDFRDHAITVPSPGALQGQDTMVLGKFLRDVVQLNQDQRNFRIVDSMFSQHAKWLRVTRELPWRQPIASLNYLLASHVWQQDHNGFTRRDPGFLDHVINKKADIVCVDLPPDANCLLSVFDHCLRSRNDVNVVVAGKHALPQWLTMDAAILHCTEGIGIWPWASNDQGGRSRRGDGLLRRHADARDPGRRIDPARAPSRAEGPRVQRRRPDAPAIVLRAPPWNERRRLRLAVHEGQAHHLRLSRLPVAGAPADLSAGQPQPARARPRGRRHHYHPVRQAGSCSRP